MQDKQIQDVQKYKQIQDSHRQPTDIQSTIGTYFEVHSCDVVCANGEKGIQLWFWTLAKLLSKGRERERLKWQQHFRNDQYQWEANDYQGDESRQS